MASYRLDLHVHCSQYSPCGRATAAQMAASAVAAGLDALVFTNHNCYLPPDLLARLRAAFGRLRIYNGIEVSVAGEHVLCVGRVLPELQTWEGTCAELVRYVLEREGAAVIAHPFRFRDDVSAIDPGFPPCGVEVSSRNLTDPQKQGLARRLAQERGWRMLCNSDAHDTGDLGLYGNRVRFLPSDEMELACLLRAPEGWLLGADAE